MSSSESSCIVVQVSDARSWSGENADSGEPTGGGLFLKTSVRRSENRKRADLGGI